MCACTMCSVLLREPPPPLFLSFFLSSPAAASLVHMTPKEVFFLRPFLLGRLTVAEGGRKCSTSSHFQTWLGATKRERHHQFSPSFSRRAAYMRSSQGSTVAPLLKGRGRKETPPEIAAPISPLCNTGEGGEGGGKSKQPVFA